MPDTTTPPPAETLAARVANAIAALRAIDDTEIDTLSDAVLDEFRAITNRRLLAMNETAFQRRQARLRAAGHLY